MKKILQIAALFIVILTGKNSFAQRPTITSFSPATGPVGATVTIVGTNFNTTASNDVVFFGAVRASVNSASSTQLMVTVPLGASYQNLSITDLATGLTGYSTQPFMATLDCGGETLSSRTAYSTGGSSSYASAIGDLNGDGKAEAIVVNYDPFNGLCIYQNVSTAGQITLGTKTNYGTPGNATSVAVGDLDGDSKPDIVVADYGMNKVRVYKNNGTGGSITFYSYDIGFSNAGAYGVSIGDIDGDGRPDLAVSFYTSNYISILRNVTPPGGPVSFDAGIFFSISPTANPREIAVGDLDGDLKPDIAVVNSGTSTITLMKNTSTPGVISLGAYVSYPTGTTPFAIRLGDLDGDGKTDISVANNGTSNISIFKNTSSAGTISMMHTADYPSSGSGAISLAVGDLNGDGKPDLAVGNMNTSYPLSIFHNTSSSGAISMSAATGYTFSPAINGRGLSVGDLDGDGKQDILMADYGTTLSTIRNLSGPVMTSAGTATVCSGSQVNLPLTANISSTFSWVASDNPNTTGESLTPQSGATLNNAITNNTSTIQQVTYTVTPIYGTCYGAPQTVVVSVNPAPMITSSLQPLTYCNGAQTSTVAISGTATLFSWTNNNTSVGLAANGSGNIPTFTAGTGSATVTVTPYYNTCPGTPQAFAITVNPTVTVGPPLGNLNPCIGVSMSPITHSSTGATGIGTPTGLPAGLTASWTSNTISISGTPSSSGTFNYSIPLIGCGNVSAAGTISVAPALAITSQPSTASSTLCIGSTPPTLSVGATGKTLTYQWYSNGSSIGGATSSNYTPSTASAGDNNFYVVVSDGCGGSVTSNLSGSITVLPIVKATISYPNGLNVCSSNVVLVASNFYTTPPATYSYSWSSGDVTQSINEDFVGTFTVTVTGMCGTSQASVTTIRMPAHCSTTRIAAGSPSEPTTETQPESPNVTEVTASPNPVNDEATISVPTIEKVDRQILIYDMLGRPVNISVMKKSEWKVIISTKDMAEGLYIINMSYGDWINATKMMVMHR